MAVRRKVEQQRRKQLYTEDNEDVQGNSTEEDEDIMPKKKEKTLVCQTFKYYEYYRKLKAAKPEETDNSENDEDYVAEEEGMYLIVFLVINAAHCFRRRKFRIKW